jgi:hypothetical protein
MTHTIQPRTLPHIKKGKPPTFTLPETGKLKTEPAITEIYASLRTLCMKLNSLDFRLKRKVAELNKLNEDANAIKHFVSGLKTAVEPEGIHQTRRRIKK